MPRGIKVSVGIRIRARSWTRERSGRRKWEKELSCSSLRGQQLKRGDNLLTKLEFCARNAAQHYESHLSTLLHSSGNGATNLMSCHLYKKQPSGQKVAKYLATLRAEHTREKETRRHSVGRGAVRGGSWETAGNTPWGTWECGHEAGGASVIHAIRSTAAGHKNGLK